MITRRSLFPSAAAPLLSAAVPKQEQSFLFRARGPAGLFGGGERTALMRTDGSGLKVFDFTKPNHSGWGVYAFFRDGRALLLSIERNPDWDTKAFQEFYAKSRTHLWICDLKSGRLTEIADKDRVAPFYQPAALLPSEDRLLVTASINGKEVLHAIDLDGRNPRPLTSPDEYVYGVALSPDAKRVAFHANYRIVGMNIDGTGRVDVAGKRGMLYFGPQWSHDGQWLSFQVCDGRKDPGHDWSDVWIARPDGRDATALTNGYGAWFAASYGKPDNPGSGSNIPKWSPNGHLLYNRRLPDSRPPWKYNPHRPDTNHFNRDFLPDQARGGSELWAVDVRTRKHQRITTPGAGLWDFRGEWSPDGRRILHCRAAVGANPSLRVVDRDGRNGRHLTDGIDGYGADHPRWIPAGV